VPIKKIEPGVDLGWSRDKATGEMAWKPVLAAYSNTYAETVTLTIRDVETDATHTIVSNRIHPFYVSTADTELRLVANGGALPGTITTGSWIEAQHLDIGARLLDADGTASEVIGKSIESAPLQAYNLTVADFHTYFVSGADNDNAPPVWVHNTCSLFNLNRLPQGLRDDVLDVLSKINQGTAKGHPYVNRTEPFLPKGIPYTSYDVAAQAGEAGRGAYRVVTGNDGSRWFTGTHYRTWNRIR
jgi:guanyl-specific ribonuclease Sa